MRINLTTADTPVFDAALHPEYFVIYTLSMKGVSTGAITLTVGGKTHELKPTFDYVVDQDCSAHEYVVSTKQYLSGIPINVARELSQGLKFACESAHRVQGVQYVRRAINFTVLSHMGGNGLLRVEGSPMDMGLTGFDPWNERIHRSSLEDFSVSIWDVILDEDLEGELADLDATTTRLQLSNGAVPLPDEEARIAFIRAHKHSNRRQAALLRMERLEGVPFATVAPITVVEPEGSYLDELVANYDPETAAADQAAADEARRTFRERLEQYGDRAEG